MPNTPKRKAILTMELSTEPSMCMVRAHGSTRSLTSLGTPMLSQASLFTGMVAAEDWVAKAVTAGAKMFLSMRFHTRTAAGQEGVEGEEDHPT